MNLPTTPLMLENAALLMQGDTTVSWPLLCDPVSYVLGFLRSYLKAEGLVEVRYSVGDPSHTVELKLDSSALFSGYHWDFLHVPGFEVSV